MTTLDLCFCGLDQAAFDTKMAEAILPSGEPLTVNIYSQTVTAFGKQSCCTDSLEDGVSYTVTTYEDLARILNEDIPTKFTPARWGVFMCHGHNDTLVTSLDVDAKTLCLGYQEE